MIIHGDAEDRAARENLEMENKSQELTRENLEMKERLKKLTGDETRGSGDESEHRRNGERDGGLRGREEGS